MRDKSPVATDLLNLFASFAPEAIRREWIVACAEHLPKTLAAAVNDEIEFDRIVAAFRRYSLVEVSAEQNTFTVHCLVQTVMRARMTDEELAKWAEAAVRLVNDVFPADDFYQAPYTWPLCNELLPHALLIIQQTETLNVAKEQTTRLLNQVRFYLRSLARNTEAGETLNRALAIVERADHPRKMRLLKHLGDPEQARHLFERALTVFHKFHGDNHPITTTARTNPELLIETMSGK